MKKLFLAILLLCFTVSVYSKVELPSVISDNMVLQQNSNVALWGTASPGKTVSITSSWMSSPVKVKSDKTTGDWSVSISTPSAGGPYEINFNDGDILTLKNILIGEVWFCGGQSNMDMPMKGYDAQPVTDSFIDIVNAKRSTPIRICKIEKVKSLTPLKQSIGSWQENTPDIVAKTSAIAYFFAKTLHDAIDVPVGIIINCWGGTTIETWMKRDVIEEKFPEYDLGYLDGKYEVPDAKHPHSPCLLWNGMVNPIVPFTFKGMIWYQGCSNRSAARYKQYAALQVAYAEMMRKEFNNQDAPFYFVQLAPYLAPSKEAKGINTFLGGYFAEAQKKTLDLIPHSGMAVTCDVGEYGTIHPSHKREVGQRLAFLALSHDYGFSFLQADSPSYKSVEYKDGKAFVHMDVDGMGVNPMRQEITGFELAGVDKIFHPAVGRVEYDDRKTVVVSCEEVPEPIAVRYCFRDWCRGNLYNTTGIPVGPFRTDDWDLE